MTALPPVERKVWVGRLRHAVGAGEQFMVEQFGDQPPTVAFRDPDGGVWGPPSGTEAR
jgi:hypothetical protein